MVKPRTGFATLDSAGTSLSPFQAEHELIVSHLDDFLGPHPTLRGRREVLYSFANIVLQLSRGEPLSIQLLNHDEAPSYAFVFANAARAYARTVSQQLRSFPKGTEGEPQPPVFEDVLQRAAQPDGYLYAYEALPEPSSGSSPKGTSAEHCPWLECFALLMLDDPPAGPPQPSMAARGRA